MKTPSLVSAVVVALGFSAAIAVAQDSTNPQDTTIKPQLIEAQSIESLPAEAAQPIGSQPILLLAPLDPAVGQTDDLTENNPYDPVQLNNLATLEAEQGHVFVALDLLNRAVQLTPNNTVIAQNRDQLRSWLADRIGAASSGSPAQDFRNAQARPRELPDPPPLWN